MLGLVNDDRVVIADIAQCAILTFADGMYHVRALSIRIVASSLGEGKKSFAIDRAKIGCDRRWLFIL